MNNKDYERFWSYVVKGEPSECWKWLGPVCKDRATFSFNGGRSSTSAQHILYEIENGKLPLNSLVKCSCGKKDCVNPAHLYHKTKEQRFWSKVNKAGIDDCWEWTGYIRPDKYGDFYSDINKSSIVAHRFSWILTFGDIPDNLLVCHKCDNPPCVNPKHLFLATHEENMLDMRNKGRSFHNPYNKLHTLSTDELISFRNKIDQELLKRNRS